MMRERAWEFGDDYAVTPAGLYVPAKPRRTYARPVGVDLFAGAGGFSCGMHQAGFHVAAALEFDPWAAITYAVNLGAKGVQFHFDSDEREKKFTRCMEQHLGLRKSNAKTAAGLMSASGLCAGDGWISHYGCLGCASCLGYGADGSGPHEYLTEINKAPVHADGCEHMWVADASAVTGYEILERLDLDRGEVDVVFGGPPCQGFSIAGRRNVVDPRNSLVFEFARIVCEIAPRAFVMENVMGITSMTTPEGLPVLDALALYFADNGMGAYDALKQSLASTAGLGAAVKGAHKPKRQKRAADAESDQDDDETEDELVAQGALFD